MNFFKKKKKEQPIIKTDRQSLYIHTKKGSNLYNDLLNTAMKEGLDVQIVTDGRPSGEGSNRFIKKPGVSVPNEEFDRLLEIERELCNNQELEPESEESFYIYAGKLYKITEVIGIEHNLFANIISSDNVKLKININPNNILKKHQIDIIQKGKTEWDF